MARFVYRMQSILNIKIQMEDQARLELGIAQRHLLEEQEKLDELFRRKEEYLEASRRLRQDAMKVEELRESEQACKSMDYLIRDQKRAVEKAERVVEEATAHLQELMQERKMQEKLREHAFEQFLQDEKKSEAKEVDELTSYTHSRQKGESHG